MTNDTTLLSNQGGMDQSMYCHMLNSKGRFVYDLLIYRPKDADHVIIDVSSKGKERLMKTMKMYSLRKGVHIDDVSSEVGVWAGLPSSSSSSSSVDVEDSRHENSCIVFAEDPRLKELGRRGVFTRDFQPPERALVSEYTVHRIKQGIAEGPDEIPEGSVPLEYNIDALHGISFEKGCYIGQELMARTHYQGQIRKRLVPCVVKSDDISPERGEDIVDETSEKSVGTLRACENGVGLAHVRMAHAFSSQGQTLKTAESGVVVEPYIPGWWPKEWTSGS